MFAPIKKQALTDPAFFVFKGFTFSKGEPFYVMKKFIKMVNQKLTKKITSRKTNYAFSKNSFAFAKAFSMPVGFLPPAVAKCGWPPPPP